MFKKLISFFRRLFSKKYREYRVDVKSALWREKHLRDDCSYNDYLKRCF